MARKPFEIVTIAELAAFAENTQPLEDDCRDLMSRLNRGNIEDAPAMEVVLALMSRISILAELMRTISGYAAIREQDRASAAAMANMKKLAEANP